ncbi:MAG: hypothetical protein KF686_03280 [Ramlibacter sp.]|nr:hypothetical protein [Ramlibacter sp.]
MAWLVRTAIAAAVVAGIIFAYSSWRNNVLAEGDRAGAARVQAQWDKDKIQRATATLEAVGEARLKEQLSADLTAQGERDAIRKANAQAARDRAAAGQSAAAADKLRDDLEALNVAARALDLPTAAACPSEFARQRAQAIRARELFGACTAEYRALGEAADGALRGITLRLDTALSYIKAVAPAP